MTATDELRKLLDERGVEWESDEFTGIDRKVGYWYTYWGDGGGCCYCEPIGAEPGTLGAKCDFSAIGVTPEQAIAATLGAGTCHMSFVDEYETVSGEEEYLCECSECGYRRWEPAHDLPLFCSKCGRKVDA